jgi:hypothetical protein
MESGYSLRCSQETVSCPYPEPHESNSCHSYIYTHTFHRSKTCSKTAGYQTSHNSTTHKHKQKESQQCYTQTQTKRVTTILHTIKTSHNSSTHKHKHKKSQQYHTQTQTKQDKTHTKSNIITFIIKLFAHLRLGPPRGPFTFGFPTRILHAFRILTIRVKFSFIW